MPDSGTVTMPANNAMVECIAPMTATQWMTLQATGNKDVNLFVYVSGLDSEWSESGHWVLAQKVTIGDEGAFYRVPPSPYFTVRGQGPVGQTCRVTVS